MKNGLNNTEEIGIIEVHRIITQDFGWIFREKNKKDIGIDAEAETIEDGLLIQIQIKTGPSHLKLYKKNNKTIGYTHYVKNYHYQYWLNLKAPVLFLAHLPDNGKTYWQVIERSNFIKTKNKNWKLLIPIEQVFDLTAKKMILDRIIKLPDPKIFYTPDINSNSAVITTEPIYLGGRVNIFASGNTFISDSPSFNQFFETVIKKGLLYNDLNSIRETCYSNPNDMNCRFMLIYKYMQLEDYNNAIIENKNLINALIKITREKDHTVEDMILLVWARFWYDILVSNHSNFFQRIRSVKLTFYVRVQIVGEELHLMKVEHFIISNNNIDYKLHQYRYNIFLLPDELPLSSILNGKQNKFMTRIQLRTDENGLSPKFKGFSYGLEIGFIEEGNLLEEYSISLMPYISNN